MSVLPDAAPLDDPPGRPGAVLDAAEEARSAARLLQELAEGVAVARAPAWHGEDARATADRSATVCRLAADAAASLLRAAARLVEHAEVWHAVQSGIAGLRSEQEHDRAAARARVAVPLDPLDPFATPVDGVLTAVAAAERRRAAEHRRLLEVLEDDAADTGRVLRACCSAVGAVDRRAGSGGDVAYLAALLPAWAASELAARGHELAGLLTHGPGAGSEAAAADALALAGEGAFAAALLGGLGVDGLRQLLVDLDHVELGEGSAVARLLAAAWGTAAALPHRDGGVTDVLAAGYVDPRDGSTLPDQVARGLAVVALTGARYGRPPDSATLGAWGRQMVAREAALGPSSDRLGLLAEDAVDADPLQGLVAAIARRGDATAAAELLADRPTWTVLLARGWLDDGAAFADVVGSLAHAPDLSAQVAIRSGLEGLGDGLQDGHPDGWTADLRTAAAVVPALGAALGVHVGVVTGLLAEVAERCPSADRLALLRGLAVLSIDRSAAAAVHRGLDAWRSRPPDDPLTGAGEAVLVAVPAAFLAVQHYGQRLEFALGTHARGAEAARSRRRWDWSVGLLVDVVMTVFGKRVPGAEPLVAAAETTVQGWVGADGRWRNGRDDGPRLSGSDAARWVTAGLGERGEDGLRQVGRAGAESFASARAALGEPVIATPDQGSILTDVLDDVTDVDPRGRPGSRGGPRPDVGAGKGRAGG